MLNSEHKNYKHPKNFQHDNIMILFHKQSNMIACFHKKLMFQSEPLISYTLTCPEEDGVHGIAESQYFKAKEIHVLLE